MLILIAMFAGLLLAFANGGNDNFKGVATLLGSDTTSYRRALAWATVTTLAGSLAAALLADQLLKCCSGKGLVSDALVADPRYAAAVALGAALAVLIATRVGMPVSTTHALVGALVGAGLAAESDIVLARLGSSFFLPLALSPAISLGAAAILYPAMRRARTSLGVTAETCLCVGAEVVEIAPAHLTAMAVQRAQVLSVQLGESVECRSRYGGRLLGVDAASFLNGLHFLSAGALGFARGLNDTPKIAALLLIAPALGGVQGVALVGAAMAIGGVLNVRRVAETMSRRITSMNHGQGFTANAVACAIVLGASHLGLPVSTTHVSCGALMGIGSATKQAHWRTVGAIVAAWFLTLPLAASLGAASLWIVSEVK